MNPLELNGYFALTDVGSAGAGGNNAATELADEPLMALRNDTAMAQTGLDAVTLSTVPLEISQDEASPALATEASVPAAPQLQAEPFAEAVPAAKAPQDASSDDIAASESNAPVSETTGTQSDAAADSEPTPTLGSLIQAAIQEAADGQSDSDTSREAPFVADYGSAASTATASAAPAKTTAVGSISEQYIAQNIQHEVQVIPFGSHSNGKGQTQEEAAVPAGTHSVDSKAVSGLLSKLSLAEAADIGANPGLRLGKLQSLLSESQSMARQLFLTASANAGDPFWATLDQIRAIQSRILSSMGNVVKSAPVVKPAAVAAFGANQAGFSAQGTSAGALTAGGGGGSNAVSPHRSFVG